jgi:Kef-type K+ transport system membrane component KefB/mannitol/fructose-specific phosphotransferase system IIA component (Ntr-type)
MSKLTHDELIATFLAIGTLIAAARLLGEVARRFGQPAILGEILAGVLLGKTVLDQQWPQLYTYLFPETGGAAVVRDGIGKLAVTLFLLVAGMEVDLSSVWRQGRTALTVSIAGIIIPAAVGFSVAAFAPALLENETGVDSMHFAYFFATALSISALPVIAKTLMDLNLFRSDLGMVVMSSAIFEDLVGWIMFAVVLGLIGTGPDRAHSITETITWTLAFAFGMLTIGRWLLNRILPYIHAYASWPGGVLGFVLVLALFGGAFTEWIGLHAVFGSFMVGVALGDSPHLRERTRATIDQFVSFFFAPLFFASIGLQVNFIANFSPALVAIVLVIACIGKIVGCGLGARLSGFRWREATAVGFAMNSRGAMEIILGLLALQYGVIGQRMFVALVVMALVTSLISGPLIVRALNRPKRRRFADFLHARGFSGQIGTTERAAVIDELARAAAAIANHDPAVVTASVLEREQVMATGLSNGIAVPHARLANLAQPVVVVALSRGGIDFEAPDGGVAHIVILLLTPADDDGLQLELLEDIGRTFADEQLRQQAVKVRSYTEFLGLIKTARPG